MTDAREAKISAALAGIADDLAGEAVGAVAEADLQAMAEMAADVPTLKRWIKRRIAGEPLAYVLGGFTFGGRWFTVDKRAYVTDPETLHLVEAVAERVRVLERGLGRPVRVTEFGVGCGSLALTLKALCLSIEIVGVDLDPGALGVAAENARRLGLDLRLVEADLFEPWPGDLLPPDLIFGDPPWGDEAALYDAARPAEHYAAMPAASAYPLGGVSGLHVQVLRAVRRLGWPSEIWLNAGVLGDAALAPVRAEAREWALVRPAPGLTIIQCRV